MLKKNQNVANHEQFCDFVRILVFREASVDTDYLRLLLPIHCLMYQ